MRERSQWGVSQQQSPAVTAVNRWVEVRYPDGVVYRLATTLHEVEAMSRFPALVTAALAAGRFRQAA